MQPPKRNQRLLTSKQFRTVYERGQKFHSPFFSAFILPTDKGLQRLGVTTTRKIGGAVLRNRCRRRLREIFRLRDQTTLVGLGYDVVLNVKPIVATADYNDLAAAFAQTLSRFRQAVGKAKDAELAK